MAAACTTEFPKLSLTATDDLAFRRQRTTWETTTKTTQRNTIEGNSSFFKRDHVVGGRNSGFRPPHLQTLEPAPPDLS